MAKMTSMAAALASHAKAHAKASAKRMACCAEPPVVKRARALEAREKAAGPKGIVMRKAFQ